MLQALCKGKNLTEVLSKRDTGCTLYILDEPTTGLHFADWLLDMGPEGGAGGGQLLIAGTPEDVAPCEGSHTGRFLRTLLAIR